jgi:hypothetical protein
MKNNENHFITDGFCYEKKTHLYTNKVKYCSLCNRQFGLFLFARAKRIYNLYWTKKEKTSTYG